MIRPFTFNAMTKTRILYLIGSVILFFAFIFPPVIIAQSSADNMKALFQFVEIGDNGLIYGILPNENYNSDDDYIISFYQDYAVIDRHGNVIIDGKNRCMKKTSKNEPYAVFGEKGKGQGIMDSDFNVILPAEKQEIEVFDEYAAIKKANSANIEIIEIPTNKVVGDIPAKHKIEDISDSMILAADEEHKQIFFHLNGEVAISQEQLSNYSSVFGFREGRAMVGQSGSDENVGFIDKTGKLVIPCNYYADLYDSDPSYSFFSNGLATVEDKNTEQWGAIDRNGNIIIPFNYSWILPFTEETSPACELDGITTVELDKQGKIVKNLPDKYMDYTSGLTPFIDNDSGLVGFKNLEGDIVIPAIFTVAEHFKNDLALVRYNNMLALINKKGEILIPNLEN